MGLGDYIPNPKDTVTRGVRDILVGALSEWTDKTIPRLESIRDETIGRGRKAAQETVDETMPRVQKALDEAADRTIAKIQQGADEAILKIREAADKFVGDLEKKWEERLKQETRDQLRLLNRVLLYTLLMALIAIGYAVAKRKLGL